jgi:NAD(P) transhydrogenase subunit alpha
MRVGVPKETAEGEHRVALVPEVVAKLKAKGLDVLVENGAGAGALLPDAAFADAGAQLTADAVERWSSRSPRRVSGRSGCSDRARS